MSKNESTDRFANRKEKIRERLRKQEEDHHVLKHHQSLHVDKNSTDFVKRKNSVEQIEESQRRLTRLLSKTSNRIHSVRSTEDEKESYQRTRVEAIRQELRAKLLAEAERSALKNATVATKWSDLFSIEIPQELIAGMEKQKVLCDQIIESKECMVHDMMSEVLKKDDEYVKLLKSQTEELNILLQRMNEQENQLHSAYKTELKEIEKSFAQERSDLLEENDRVLDELDKKRNLLEQKHIDQYLQTAEDYELLLKDVREKDVDEYNALKNKLELDIQSLEQHLETMRATYQLNAEKLEYNYRVLLERDLENSTTINQQKRKISKQRDVLCGLKAKHVTLEKRFSDENSKLKEEYKRITEHFKELQLKFQTLEDNEITKFQNIWRMKESHVFEMVKKVLEADQVIQEQLLGWNWFPPNESIFKFDPRSYGSETRSNLDSSNIGDSKDNGLDDEVRQLIDSGAYHSMLELLCDEAGFLLDDKAWKVINSVPQNEQGYVKAEEVVQSLGIREVSAFEALTDAMLTESDGDKPPGTVNVDSKDKGNELQNFDLQRGRRLIHPNEVLRKLKNFVEDEITPTISVPSTTKSTAKKNKSTGISQRALRRASLFWERLANSVDAKTFRVWKVLDDHLHKYYHILKHRATMMNETSHLKEQNRELKKMLNQYLSSKLNEELVIPPVQGL